MGCISGSKRGRGRVRRDTSPAYKKSPLCLSAWTASFFSLVEHVLENSTLVLATWGGGGDGLSFPGPQFPTL